MLHYSRTGHHKHKALLRHKEQPKLSTLSTCMMAGTQLYYIISTSGHHIARAQSCAPGVASALVSTTQNTPRQASGNVKCLLRATTKRSDQHKKRKVS